MSTSSKSRLPIVFIHRGGDAYLACSVAQARRANPDAEIYLVGDKFNRGMLGVTHLEWRDYFSSAAEELAKLYQHRNTNSPEYELFCMHRWMILREVMRRNGFSACLYMDSDVLLYDNVEKIAASLSDVDWTTSSYSPHFTLWLRPEALGQFCDFMLEAYRDPAKFARLETRYLERQAAGRMGGVSDMTVFEHFIALGQTRVKDTFALSGLAPCDHAMGNDQGRYEMADGVKRIEWRDGLPCGFNKQTGQWVTFQALHFQGPSKGKIWHNVRIGAGPQQLVYRWNWLMAKKGKYWQKWERRSS